MRLLAIDYGTARIGLAISDETGTIARPYRTIPSNGEAAATIATIVKEEGVGEIVLGMPYDLRGKETESTRNTQKFAEQLRPLLTCPITERDESLSSRKAVERMVEAGVGKKRRREKENIDAWAAAIVLQEYLDQR